MEAMLQGDAKTRRTRFVCVSDTHNAIPGGAFQLPKGDVLIHAGDMTNQGTYMELKKALKWIEEADFEAKIVIAGNHDITLDGPFYQEYGIKFHNQRLEDAGKCQKLLENSPSITYLRHESAMIKLTAEAGPRTTFKIFGSPYSPAKGMWAFGYENAAAESLWNKIPFDSDIVVTHTPPKYHLDERSDRRAAGCEALRCRLWRVRPRLAICGHVHEGRGADIIRWDLDTANIKYKENNTIQWIDPGAGNKKRSIVNLSAEGGIPLDNDGSHEDLAGTSNTSSGSKTLQSSKTRSPPATFSRSEPPISPISSFLKSKHSVEHGLSQVANSLCAVPTESFMPATIGQGGTPPSARCDIEALLGRMGRKETCIINAAIRASSWPHKGSGGKRFNKAIIVDIDLPCFS